MAYLKAKLSFSLILIFISSFLFYGSFIGYLTAKKHMSSFRANQLIELAQDYSNTEKCSIKIKDFGKGGSIESKI